MNSDTAFCEHCGAALGTRGKFCDICGQPLGVVPTWKSIPLAPAPPTPGPEPTSPPVNKRLALWLLGGLVLLILIIFIVLQLKIGFFAGPQEQGATVGPINPGSSPQEPASDTAMAAKTLSEPKVTGPQPTWSDNLQQGADSGAVSFARPRLSQRVPPFQVSAWTALTPEGLGVAQLYKLNDYIGYVGARLHPHQGAITFAYRPLPNLAGIYAQRQPHWTIFGTNPPPNNGYLLDTIGWNEAPPGAFSLILDPRPDGFLKFVIWDGKKWSAATWKPPVNWKWNSQVWYKLGVSWGPKGFGIIVNGRVQAWNPTVLSINNAIPWFLGQAPGYWPYGPHTMVGEYSQVKCYDVQLGQDP